MLQITPREKAKVMRYLTPFWGRVRRLWGWARRSYYGKRLVGAIVIYLLSVVVLFYILPSVNPAFQSATLDIVLGFGTLAFVEIFTFLSYQGANSEIREPSGSLNIITK